MLEFIFNYTWAGILIISYAIWSFYSIRDIVRMRHAWKDQFDLDDLNESTMFWITITIIGAFSASLLY